MQHVYIDTGLLAVPNYSSSTEEAASVFERLLEIWQCSLSGIPINFALSSAADEVLAEHNVYPNHDELQGFVELFDLKWTYSPNDLMTAYLSILDRTPRVGIDLGSDIAEVSDFNSTPPYPDSVYPLELMNASQRNVSAAAYNNLVSQSWHFVSGVSFGSEQVTVKTNIATFVPEGAAQLPFLFEGAVSLLSQISTLARAEIAEAYWAGAQSDSELAFSIFLGAIAARKAAGESFTTKDIKAFSIGSHFRETLSNTKCAGTGPYSHVTYSHLVKVIAALAELEANPFKDATGGQKKRSYDSASAWRLHVTKSGEAIRLMWWDNGGKIEFANVGTKVSIRHRPRAL